MLTHWSPERLGDVLDGYGADDALRTRVGMLWTTYSMWRHLFVSRWYHENRAERVRSAREARRVLEEDVLGGHVPHEVREPVEPVRLDCDVILLDFDGLMVDTIRGLAVLVGAVRPAPRQPAGRCLGPQHR